MSIEAMKQALEALERYSGVDQRACDAEEALRQAIEQAEQAQPVAWTTGFYAGHCVIRSADPAAVLPIGVALYTAPPHRKPLTSEEYSILAEKYTGADGLDCVDYGRAIARHYGIKE